MHDHDTLLLLTGSLENEIISLRTVKSNQLFVVYLPLFCFHFDEPWKFCLADLTLKFGKIIVLGTSNNFLLDFDPYPLSQTAIMNRSATAIAQTRIEEEIIVFLGLI